MEGVKAAV
jgi:hypothetical protein